METSLLTYDPTVLNTALTHMKDPTIMKQYLADVATSVAEIQRLCGKGDIFTWQEFIRVHLNIIFSTAEKIKCCFEEASLGQEYKTALLNMIDPFYDTFWEKAEMSQSDRQILEDKTTKLWQEQIISLNEGRESTPIGTPQLSPVSVYFCWSAPTKRFHSLESWVPNFISTLYGELKQTGLTPIMNNGPHSTEEGSKKGDPTQLGREIEESQVVLVFSTRSLGTLKGRHPHTQSEIELIAQQPKRKIIPVLLSGTVSSALPISLYKIPVFDAREHTSYRQFVAALLTSIIDRSV